MTDQSKAAQQADKFRKYIAQPVLTNINVSFDGFDAYDIEPKNVHDLFAEKPIVVFGKFKGKAKGSIEVTGTSGERKFKKNIKVETAKSENNDALRYLWARNKIMYLSDYNTLNRGYNKLFKEKITELGLKYSLLTEYTSFVGVDNEVRKHPSKHQQHSFGNSSGGAVPEPHEWALILLVMGIAAYLMYSRIFKTAISD